MIPALQTLFLPLENGDLPYAAPALFLGAASHPFLAGHPMDKWQPFKPLALGIQSLPSIPEGKTYALALVQLPKQVEEAKYWLALALERLQPGGILLACAANDAGGSRIIGWLKEAGLESSSLSKNKCRAVWTTRPAALSPLIATWRAEGSVQAIDIGDGIDFTSQPGLFSWDRIDEGSRLLVGLLPANLSGTGADFGAGTGYLSHHLLKKSKGVQTLHVLEADARALDCARINLAPVRGDSNLVFGWEDLSKPPAALPKLDFIIMNPPFHTGKKTDASLGCAFIENATLSLKKGGTLWMVANVHLPYEDILKTNFQTVRPPVQKDGFKIFEAVK